MFATPFISPRLLALGGLAITWSLLLCVSAEAQLAPQTTSGAARYFGPPRSARTTKAPSYRAYRGSTYLTRPRSTTIIVNHGRGASASVYYLASPQQAPALDVRTGRPTPLPRTTYPRTVPPRVTVPRVTVPSRVAR